MTDTTLHAGRYFSDHATAYGDRARSVRDATRDFERRPSTRIPSDIDIMTTSCEMFCQFVEHLADTRRSAALGTGCPSSHRVDWDALRAAATGSTSIEQAIGRAVVEAERMFRSEPDDSRVTAIQVADSLVADSQVAADVSRITESDLTVAPAPFTSGEPFFAFSVADVVPDFGDGTRYRTKIATKVGRIFKVRRAA